MTFFRSHSFPSQHVNGRTFFSCSSSTPAVLSPFLDLIVAIAHTIERERVRACKKMHSSNGLLKWKCTLVAVQMARRVTSHDTKYANNDRAKIHAARTMEHDWQKQICNYYYSILFTFIIAIELPAVVPHTTFHFHVALLLLLTTSSTASKQPPMKRQSTRTSRPPLGRHRITLIRIDAFMHRRIDFIFIRAPSRASEYVYFVRLFSDNQTDKSSLQ